MKPIPRGIARGTWVTRSAKRRGEYSTPLRCSKCGRVIETGERYRRTVRGGFGFRHVSECLQCAQGRAAPNLAPESGSALSQPVGPDGGL